MNSLVIDLGNTCLLSREREIFVAGRSFGPPARTEPQRIRDEVLIISRISNSL